MDTLKPCPFCGMDGGALVGQYDYDYRDDRGIVYITCKKCNGRGPDAHGEEEAKEAWNERADSPELQSNDKNMRAFEIIPNERLPWDDKND